MASGFNATALDTGLLSGINRNIAQQQQNVELGDKEQYAAFEEASKQFQTSKDKASDQKAKIDAMAPTLRFDNDDSDAAKMASLSVARDGVTNGWDSKDYTPFLQEAYRRTKADIVNNPDKWNVAPQTDERPDIPNYVADTNPANSAALHRFNPNLSTPQIEQIRQNKIDRPYANIPGGSYPNASQFGIQQDVDKANAMIAPEVAKQNALAQAKKTQEESGEAAGEAKLGIGPSSDASPAGMGTPTDNKDLQVAASDLSPDAKGGPEGIKINSLPPPEGGAVNPDAGPRVKPPGTEGLSDEATQASLDNNGKFSTQRYLDYVKSKDRIGGGIVEGLVNGEYPINPNALERPNPKDPDAVNPFWKYVVAAKIADPTFSTTDFAARQKTAQDYSPGGPVGKQLMANNTALGHIGLAYQAVDGLHNSDIQALNKIANGLGAQTGSVASVVFNSIMGRLAPEVVQAYRPSAGTGEEVAQARADLSRDLSGPQAHAVLTTMAQALKSKMDAARSAYVQQMGPVIGPANVDKKAGYSPEAKAVMDKLGLSTDMGQQEQTLKAVQQQPNLPKMAPDEAMKQPPGTQFILPDGRIGTVPPNQLNSKQKP